MNLFWNLSSAFQKQARTWKYNFLHSLVTQPPYMHMQLYAYTGSATKWGDVGKVKKKYGGAS